MRRSGAPSQLSGNAAKKPRFMPPLSRVESRSSLPSPTPTPTLGNVLLSKVQMCLSSGDASAVSKAPASSKALARVLSALPQGECKENNLRSSSSDFSEAEQSTDKDSCSVQPSTHTNAMSTGKN